MMILRALITTRAHTPRDYAFPKKKRREGERRTNVDPVSDGIIPDFGYYYRPFHTKLPACYRFP